LKNGNFSIIKLRKMIGKQKIGILGVGMVGGSLKRYFEKQENVELFLYDKKGLGSLGDLNKADFVYVCLPTPYVSEKGCDTSIIEEGVKNISGNKIIIIKSTVIPGTTDKMQEKFPQHKFLFNPEFLTEATADQDMFLPDRQIMGYTKESYSISKNVLQQLPLAPYEDIVPAIVAEFIKYANNTWFAVKVAMNNELYDLAKKTGISEEEWEKLVSGIASDKRVGRTHLTIVHKEKRGYWGKCLPKDIKALLKFAEDSGVEMPVREAANKYNDKLLNSQGVKEFI